MGKSTGGKVFEFLSLKVESKGSFGMFVNTRAVPGYRKKGHLLIRIMATPPTRTLTTQLCR